MKKKHIPTPDDILYGFAVTWDGTPQDLTKWKRDYPLWASDIENLAAEIISDPDCRRELNERKQE